MSAPATDVAVAAARGDQPARSSRPLFWSAPSFSRRCTIRYSDVGSTPSSEPTSRTVIPGRALTIESNCSRRPFWRPRPGLRALVAAPAERVVRAAPGVLAARREARPRPGAGAGGGGGEAARGRVGLGGEPLGDLLELSVLVHERAQFLHAL